MWEAPSRATAAPNTYSSCLCVLALGSLCAVLLPRKGAKKDSFRTSMAGRTSGTADANTMASLNDSALTMHMRAAKTPDSPLQKVLPHDHARRACNLSMVLRADEDGVQLCSQGSFTTKQLRSGPDAGFSKTQEKVKGKLPGMALCCS